MLFNVKSTIIGVFALIGFSAFAAVIVYFVMTLMKGRAYDLSVQVITKNHQVIESLGPPLSYSWYVLGSVQTSNQDGSAHISYKVYGTRSSATTYVVAGEKGGKWRLNKVVVEPEKTGKQIVVVNKIGHRARFKTIH